MAKAGYIVRSGSVALTAATAKTCLMVITPAQFGLDLKKVRVSFDGVTASAVPVRARNVHQRHQLHPRHRQHVVGADRDGRAAVWPVDHGRVHRARRLHQ
jgi:hypothetical protein